MCHPKLRFITSQLSRLSSNAFSCLAILWPSWLGSITEVTRLTPLFLRQGNWGSRKGGDRLRNGGNKSGLHVPRLPPPLAQQGAVSCHDLPRSTPSLYHVIAILFKTLLKIYPMKLKFLKLFWLRLSSLLTDPSRNNPLIWKSPDLSRSHTNNNNHNKPTERRHSFQDNHFKALIGRLQLRGALQELIRKTSCSGWPVENRCPFPWGHLTS